MITNVHISVVSPVYKAEGCIEELITGIIKNITLITENFEIILVNDRSPDNSWLKIQTECKKDIRVKGINLSRNFGQHCAITAGLQYCNGEWVVVMDCDLQDRPDEISNLYNKAIEGYDIVLACRINRKDNYFKRLGSHYFYKLLAYLTETKQNAEVANFGIYNKKVISSILTMHDKIKYFPAMVKWVGFSQIEIPIAHDERKSGKSSYNFKGLLKLAINTILSFSDKPLRIVVKLGIIISLISIIFASYILIASLNGKIRVLGYASLIISIWFLSGIIITILGMIGLYIGRTFEQVKNRPVFIVSDTANLNND